MVVSYFSLLRSKRKYLVTAYKSNSVSATAIEAPDMEGNDNLKGKDFPVFELEAVWGPLLSSMVISSARLRFRVEERFAIQEEPAANLTRIQTAQRTIYFLRIGNIAQILLKLRYGARLGDGCRRIERCFKNGNKRRNIQCRIESEETFGSISINFVTYYHSGVTVVL